MRHFFILIIEIILKTPINVSLRSGFVKTNFLEKDLHFNQTFADLERNKGSYFLDKIWQFWPLCTSFIQPRFLFRRDAKFKPFLEIGTVRRALIGAYHSGCFPKLFMPHAILESDSRRLFQCNTHWEVCPKFLSNCPTQYCHS